MRNAAIAEIISIIGEKPHSIGNILRYAVSSGGVSIDTSTVNMTGDLNVAGNINAGGHIHGN